MLKRTQFFFEKYIRVSIHAVNDINFKKINKHIQQSAWQQSYPMRTVITIPKSDAPQIVEVLKKHPDITLIDGELTPRGVAVQQEMRNFREALNNKKNNR